MQYTQQATQMKNGKKNFNKFWTSSWDCYRLADCFPDARKRFRLGLFFLPTGDRHSIRIFLGNRVPCRKKLTLEWVLENDYKPWWMSSSQYQAFMTRLGMPF